MRNSVFILAAGLTFSACKNQDVSYADGPNFSEIHEDIHYHFDQVAIEGSEYFILERDRNNPHEGFGFMALKANDLKDNQDSIKAYLKTVLDFQVKLNAQLSKVSEEESEAYANDLFQYYLSASKSPVRLHKTKKKAEN